MRGNPTLESHISATDLDLATRQRMLDAAGHADNQVIWFGECGFTSSDLQRLRRNCSFDPTGLAFDTIDRWIANIRANPELGVAGSKPAAAVDACFANDGSVIHAGNDAWAGILDDGPDGVCDYARPDAGRPASLR